MDKLKTLSATPRYDDATCAVDGCARPTRTWSRWCTNHARQRHRTGDVNGRILKPRELAPHRELAETFLERRKDHPAVIAAEAWAQALLHDNVRLPERVQEHLSRLRDYEVTPREILVAILSVYGMTAQFPNAFVSVTTRNANLGRVVMKLRPLPQTTSGKTGRRYSVTPPAKVAAALGEVIADEAGLWATSFWRTINAALRNPQDAAGRLKAEAEKLWHEANKAEARLPNPDGWKLTIEGAAKWAAMNQQGGPEVDDQDGSEGEP